jgi:hypothetical protein
MTEKAHAPRYNGYVDTRLIKALLGTEILQRHLAGDGVGLKVLARVERLLIAARDDNADGR